MRRFVNLQRSISRLVILVMLAATLFPALGHAFASGKSSAPGWMEVCTAGGVEARPVPTNDSGSPVQALLVQHCPYCLVSSFDDMLPSATTPSVLQLSEADTVFLTPVSSGTPPPIWPAALPRAPPDAI